MIALPIDADSLAVAGAPTVVLEDVFEGANGGVAFFDVAANGTVAFVPGSSEHSLVLVDRSGSATQVDGGLMIAGTPTAIYPCPPMGTV